MYVFKPTPEFVRALALAVTVDLLLMARDFSPAAITDWRTYAAGVLVGVLHVLGTAGLSLIAPGTPDPLP